MTVMYSLAYVALIIIVKYNVKVQKQKSSSIEYIKLYRKHNDLVMKQCNIVTK